MASDYFLEIEGVKGESVSDKHPNTIEVLSFSWGVSNPTRRLRGKLTLQDFHFSAYSSSATELLLAKMAPAANTAVIKLCTLYGTQADENGEQQDTFRIKMTDCIITSYSVANEGSLNGPGHGGGSEPVDQFSLKHAGYDVKANKKV